MDQDWIEIYRSYTADELQADISRLKRAISDAEGLSSASSASKSWTRDFAHMKSRLQAAIRVSNQSSAASTSARDAGMWGVPDFSGTKV